jgi:hypothetical protein
MNHILCAAHNFSIFAHARHGKLCLEIDDRKSRSEDNRVRRCRKIGSLGDSLFLCIVTRP